MATKGDMSPVLLHLASGMDFRMDPAGLDSILSAFWPLLIWVRISHRSTECAYERGKAEVGGSRYQSVVKISPDGWVSKGRVERNTRLGWKGTI